MRKAFILFNKIFINRTVLLAAVSVWVVAQIILIANHYSTILVSDPGLYVYYATECVRHGTMYPDFSNYHNQYIFAPGWVNFLILCIKLFGTVDIVPYLNVVFNIIIIYFIYKIAQELSKGSKAVAYIAIYAFILLPANTTIVTNLYSDLFYELLATVSFYLVLKKKCRYWVLAGILIALANWVRPLALAWAVAAICYLWFVKDRIKSIALYATSIIITCSVIAISTHRNFPDYLYTASTGGVNLIMGANDFATGAYCIEARKEGGLGYLPGLYSEDEYTPVKASIKDSVAFRKFSDKYTYSECDSIWKARSVSWIMDHPGKWLSMLPYKTTLLFRSSGFYLPNWTYQSNWALYVYRAIFEGLLFWLIIIVCVLGTFTCLWKTKENLYLLLPIILCSGMTLIAVAVNRYNFIMTPNIVIAFSITLKYVSTQIRAGLLCFRPGTGLK